MVGQTERNALPILVCGGRSSHTDYGSDVTGAICGDARRRLLAGSYFLATAKGVVATVTVRFT